MNKLLMEENEHLQKQVFYYIFVNDWFEAYSCCMIWLVGMLSICGVMLMSLQVPLAAPTDGNGDSAVTTPRNSMRDANSPAGFLAIAEEALAEFLSKATGTAVDWVQMPGMKVLMSSTRCQEKELLPEGIMRLEDLPSYKLPSW